MPEIVQCPDCQRKLKMPDSLLGKRVKCPTCGTTFTAAGEAPPAPAPAPAPARRPREEEEYEEKPAPPPRRGRDDDEEDEDDYEERPRRRRRRRRARFGGDEAPHRGGTVLTLGILSIVLGLCCAFVGIGLGIGALSMANADLPRMERGEMDPSGMGSTRAGQICGIIGLVLSVLTVILNVIIVVSTQH